MAGMRTSGAQSDAGSTAAPLRPAVWRQGMESSWTRGAGPSPQLLRLLSSTADYALVLLRVVELMAGGCAVSAAS